MQALTRAFTASFFSVDMPLSENCRHSCAHFSSTRTLRARFILFMLL